MPRAGLWTERMPRLVNETGFEPVPGVETVSNLSARARRALKRGGAAVTTGNDVVREPERQPFVKRKRRKAKPGTIYKLA